MLNDFLWWAGAVACAASLFILIYVLALLLFSWWQLDIKRHRGAPEFEAIWRSALVKGSEKTTWREHPISAVWGLSDALYGAWFIGLVRFNGYKYKRDVPNPVPAFAPLPASGANPTSYKATSDADWEANVHAAGKEVAAALNDTIPRHPNAGRYLAEVNDGTLCYLNHANEWQACPNFIVKCDACNGSGVNHHHQLWPGRVWCRYCLGTGHEPATETSAAGKSESARQTEPADEGADSPAAAHGSAPATRRVYRGCNCTVPIVRCDDRGCRCTQCGELA